MIKSIENDEELVQIENDDNDNVDDDDDDDDDDDCVASFARRNNKLSPQ